MWSLVKKVLIMVATAVKCVLSSKEMHLICWWPFSMGEGRFLLETKKKCHRKGKRKLYWSPLFSRKSKNAGQNSTIQVNKLFGKNKWGGGVGDWLDEQNSIMYLCIVLHKELKRQYFLFLKTWEAVEWKKT